MVKQQKHSTTHLKNNNNNKNAHHHPSIINPSSSSSSSIQKQRKTLLANNNHTKKTSNNNNNKTIDGSHVVSTNNNNNNNSNHNLLTLLKKSVTTTTSDEFSFDAIRYVFIDAETCGLCTNNNNRGAVSFSNMGKYEQSSHRTQIIHYMTQQTCCSIQSIYHCYRNYYTCYNDIQQQQSNSITSTNTTTTSTTTSTTTGDSDDHSLKHALSNHHLHNNNTTTCSCKKQKKKNTNADSACFNCHCLIVTFDPLLRQHLMKQCGVKRKILNISDAWFTFIRAQHQFIDRQSILQSNILTSTTTSTTIQQQQQLNASPSLITTATTTVANEKTLVIDGNNLFYHMFPRVSQQDKSRANDLCTRVLYAFWRRLQQQSRIMMKHNPRSNKNKNSDDGAYYASILNHLRHVIVFYDYKMIESFKILLKQQQAPLNDSSSSNNDENDRMTVVSSSNTTTPCSGINIHDTGSEHSSSFMVCGPLKKRKDADEEMIHYLTVEAKRRTMQQQSNNNNNHRLKDFYLVTGDAALIGRASHHKIYQGHLNCGQMIDLLQSVLGGHTETHSGGPKQRQKRITSDKVEQWLLKHLPEWDSLPESLTQQQQQPIKKKK